MTSTCHAELLASGAGDVAPLVLVHGFTGDATTWAPLIGAMGADGGNGRDVWGVDLVGHGRSAVPDARRGRPYAIGAQAEAVAGAMASRGVGRAVWMGYSMGGRVALTLAITRPEVVDRLVIVSASPGIEESAERAERAARDQELAEYIEREGLAAFVRRWEKLPLFSTQERLGRAHRERMRAQRLANRPSALAATLRQAGPGAMPALWSALPSIAVPVLWVAGEEDRAYVAIAEQAAERLPKATIAIVPRCGHAVHLEAPGLLAERVRSWLASG